MTPEEYDQMVANAVSRGWNGRTRKVVCSHIQQLLSQAQHLIKLVDDRVFPEPFPGGETEGSSHTLQSLERATQLLRHAAEELEDERLKLRDGWSV